MNDLQKPLVLKFGGSLVEQLGAQLYPSVTSTIAELISNAWDADARNVWVSVPFDEDWNEESTISVTDDGAGMSRDDAQSAYLIVGRKKRVFAGLLSASGRAFHGRKGIGKLAAFGTAGILECNTTDGVLLRNSGWTMMKSENLIQMSIISLKKLFSILVR